MGTRVGNATFFEIGSWPGTRPGWVGFAAAAAVAPPAVGCAAAVVGCGGVVATLALAVVGLGAAVGGAAAGGVVGDGAAAGPQASRMARLPRATPPAVSRSAARRVWRVALC